MADRAESESPQGTAAHGAPPSEPAPVFISYASPNAAVASALVEALERHGVACWIAPRDVDAGALYADAIVRAISSARAFVLVLSESSIDSSNVGKEVERASSKKRPIFALRIDAARDGTHLWSETYDRSVGDVLMLQDDIAVALVRALQITVGATQLNARRSLRNVEAYDVYLRGRYAMDRYDKEGFEEAASDFRQALDLDPKFADAAVALSLVYEMQANWAFVPSAVGFEQARRTADSVLKLDPALARAHTVLGMIHVHHDWDWEGAKREFEMALRSAPHDPFVLSAAGDLQLAIGHYAEAARMYKEALARDPLDASTYDILSWAEIRLGQAAQAIASERKALEIQPEYVWAATYLASWLLVAGNPEAAHAAAQREDPAVRSGALSVTLWALGRKAEAEAAHKQAIVCWPISWPIHATRRSCGR